MGTLILDINNQSRTLSQTYSQLKFESFTNVKDQQKIAYNNTGYKLDGAFTQLGIQERSFCFFFYKGAVSQQT
jgi:hypothetical protein